jgi:signal transduction histidine kinase
MDVGSLITVQSTIIAAVLAFGLGTWVYLERRDDPRRIAVGGLLVASALWSFSFALWFASSEARQTDFWMRTLYFIGSLLPAFALLATLAIADVSKPLRAVVLAPNAILFWLAYRSPGITPTTTLVFAAHFTVLTLAAAAVAARRRPDGTTVGRSAGAVAFFAAVFAVLFLIGPDRSSHLLPMATFSLVAAMFGLAATLIHRKFLVDLRLAGIEAFLFLALFVIVANVVVSESAIDFTLRLVILIVLVIVGAFSTRAMVQEVQRLKEIERLQEEVLKMNGRLLEADKWKTRFISFATHQLRTPISGVRSYLELLRAGNFGELGRQQQEVVSTTLDAMTGMRETVETFLSVAKIQMGNLELYRTPSSLGELASRVVKEMMPLATKKGLRLELHDGLGASRVSCDSSKIYHVLVNLIDNAIKYTESGGVNVVLSGKRGSVEVRVADSGVGMGEREIKTLFKQFSRGAEGIRLDASGSGLGLFLAKKIVEAHDGEIFVESPGRGKGSTFGFRIPF